MHIEWEPKILKPNEEGRFILPEGAIAIKAVVDVTDYCFERTKVEEKKIKLTYTVTEALKEIVCLVPVSVPDEEDRQ